MTTIPQRVQMPPRNQRKGWRKPKNSKLVTRATRWGNPYKAKPHGPYEPEEVIALYRRDLFGDGVQARPDLPKITLKDAMDHLRGFHLICGCPLDAPCHADLLLAACNIPHTTIPEP